MARTLGSLPDREPGRAAAAHGPAGRGRPAHLPGARRAARRGLRRHLPPAAGRARRHAGRLRGGRQRIAPPARHSAIPSIAVHAAAPVHRGADRGAPGRPDRARDAVATGIGDASEEWSSRYAWPVVWLAMRTEADDATRYRDRREDVPRGQHRALRRARGRRGAAGDDRPALAGYGQLVAAEHARAEGTDRGGMGGGGGRLACRGGALPVVLRPAAARRGARHGGRDRRGGSGRERGARAGEAARRRAGRRRGRRPRPPRPAEPRLRRRSGKRQRGRPIAASGAADELARFGLTDREREVLCSSPPGVPTRRSPRHCSSAPRRPACTSPTSSPSSASAAASRRPPSCTGSDSAAKGLAEASKALDKAAGRCRAAGLSRTVEA